MAQTGDDDERGVAPTDPADSGFKPRADRGVAPTDPADSGFKPRADRGVAPTDPAESGFEPMVDLRPAEPAGWKLARARMLGSLFGTDSTLGTFGRFRVLERLGAGGMGVVYEAYDPDLARGVALKLVNVAENARETALAEAKALARLSHPNVVPIYDVGVESDHVYLVMELVRGQTLRDWPEERTLREVLAIYRQAGAALVAAHGVGLVHRDFKPDNAIVGSDGRVRVVDFGLACEADDPSQPIEHRRIAGTPGYIAPEIKAGMAVTPAADQYSFAVSLAQALEVTGASLPRHIAAAIERGRADDPAQRFPSMAELLRVLERDPARTRRRIGAVGGLAVAVGAGAFFIGQWKSSEADPCDSGAAQLDIAWHPADRQAALDHLVKLGGHGPAISALLERGLVDHADRWVTQYQRACIDGRSGTESDALIDRRTTCLNRGKDALAAVGARVEQADLTNLAELPRAVQSMPDPAQCERDLLLSDIAPPPPERAVLVTGVRSQIARARIDIGAGRYEQALAEARAGVAMARGVGYDPVLAEALLVQGHARTRLAKRVQAVDALTEALTLAAASRDDAVEVEAWARRVYARGTTRGPDGAEAGLDVIEPVAKRRGSSTFARALLYNNLGTAELGRDQRARAREYFAQALAESQRSPGPVALELVTIRANLALVSDDHRRGDALYAEVVDELSRRLGADHPDVLDIRLSRGFVTTEDLRQAAELLAPVCSAYESWGATQRVEECWPEVGLLRLDLGDRAGALQAMESATRAKTDAEDQAYVTLLRGDAHAAERQFADAIATRPPKPDERWWHRLYRAQLQLGLGRSRREAGDLSGACEAFETAVADLEEIVREHPQASYERRLGRAQVELAFTLSALGAGPEVRLPVTDRALGWLRRVGGASDEIRTLEALPR
jgi:serine/threonine protein kinase/tetratricopeptide (TPR) repeat protein